MKKLAQRLTVIAFGIGLTSAAVIYFTHSEPKASAQPKGDKRDVPYMDGKWIRYSPEFAKRQQIEFAPAAEGSLKPMISVTGTVTFDPDRVAAIGSRISGRVSRLFKIEGDVVKAGDLLAEIESADQIGRAHV